MDTIAVNTAALPSGLTLPYAETGEPAGTPVVFVHAYVESWRYFEVLLRRLRRRCTLMRRLSAATAMPTTRHTATG